MNRLARLWPLLFCLTACGGQKTLEVSRPIVRIESRSEAQARDPFRGNGDYLANTCFGGWEQGDAGPSVQAPSRSQLVAFEKPFDPSRLDAVLSLSPRATVEFAEDEGVSVFVVPLRAGPCALFSRVDEAPDALWNIWSPANSEIGRTLLGLFLPLIRVREAGFTRPAIVLRADGDRYTLVHEFMHFIFDRARHDDSDIVVVAQARLARLQSLLPYTASDEKNPARMGAIADAWSDVAESLVKLVDQFPLEEMTVESLLGQAYAAGRLKNVTAYSRRNGDAYIVRNWSRAKSFLSAITDDIGDLKRLMADPVQKTRLDRLIAVEATVQSRLREGETIARNAQPLRPQLTSGIMTTLSSPTPCAHDIDLENLKMPKLK